MPAGNAEVAMRILFANDGIGDAGGVQSYLDAVIPELIGRGHELGFLHYDHIKHDLVRSCCAPELRKAISYFGILDLGEERALAGVKSWKADLCFSHNMNRLDIERSLLNQMTVIKMMHGYFGSCVSGLKTLSFPSPKPCDRQFGLSCMALYFPRRCGQMSVGKMLGQYRWAVSQRELFKDYTAVIVASEHMRREYANNGVAEDHLHVNPLFPANPSCEARPPKAGARGQTILFLGRMTALKGGDVLIRAVAEAVDQTGQDIRLVMAGDGPQRNSWERLAAQLKVNADFTGWVTGEKHAELLSVATLLAVPSIWPEPFGLVGLEGAFAAIPAIAFDVGGISEWLRDGYNGYLAKASPPTPGALAHVMIKALSDKEGLDLMRAGARKVAIEMSLEKHVDRLEQIFARAAQKNLILQGGELQAGQQ
ncbi:MAG TPA: glycosyltransferase family 4 protein [Blastocatellia bacterium]|nr:glycosyltransferase family 4 protein [Blastocatellia bacterium]